MSRRPYVQARVGSEELEKLDEIAYEESGPQTDVARSDVIRAALREYFRKYERESEECEPLERGKLLS